MATSIKNQTIDGYIAEYVKAHNVTPEQAVKTDYVKAFMEYADERDTAIYRKQKEKGDS